ncbi:G-protein coupled receptor 39-like [Heterodontus francisci]|uniref:G-protein coupled receptor 39-like n=1 Tax=Heterodontus francisci TaxID=7792 RepID=UPI00355C6B87
MTVEILRRATRKKEAYIRSRRLKKDEALKEYRDYFQHPQYLPQIMKQSIATCTNWDVYHCSFTVTGLKDRNSSTNSVVGAPSPYRLQWFKIKAHYFLMSLHASPPSRSSKENPPIPDSCYSSTVTFRVLCHLQMLKLSPLYDQNCTQYAKCGLTNVMYNCIMTSQALYSMPRIHRKLRVIDWSVRKMDQNLKTIDWNVTAMDQNLRTMDWNVTTMVRSFSSAFDILSAFYDWLSLDRRIYFALLTMQTIYYPILAIVGVPVNLLTIGTLSRGKCGLSKCVTRYLVAMATADLLVIILDLILRHIPIVYQEQFQSLYYIPICNIHAVLLYAATDCSVWFTVTFTFDRFVAICCQKLKSKYCSEKTAAVVLGTSTVLSCLKNITWYFMFTGRYLLWNIPWFCDATEDARNSRVWGTIEFLHYILTPFVPFMVILLLNVLTIRHILVSSRGRRRLLDHSRGERHRDPEMESRRKSIILLLIISANFILLWAVFMVFSIWSRMWYLGYHSVFLPEFLRELGFMLQLLSCCTNTAIYAVTQTQFREQLKNVLKYLISPIFKFIHCCGELNH